MADEKESLATWMKDVLFRNNWTAKDWAIKANTSPTTITRFLGQRKFVPSGKTLNKLAIAAKSVPPIGNMKVPITSNIPLMEISVNKKGRLDAVKASEVYAATETSADAIAVRLDSDTMTLGGILPNDILICEPFDKKKLKNNAIIAYYDDGISAGRFYDPFIIPASSNSEHKPVSLHTVEVIGRVVQQIRIF